MYDCALNVRRNCCRASARQLTNLDVLYSAKSFAPFHILSRISICVCPSDFSGGYFYGTRGSGLYGVCMCFFKRRIAKKKVQKTVRKLKGKYYYMANLHIAGTFHQGDERFSVQSRGKQCAFMSLSAVLTAQNIPVIDWSKTT